MCKSSYLIDALVRLALEEGVFQGGVLVPPPAAGHGVVGGGVDAGGGGGAGDGGRGEGGQTGGTRGAEPAVLRLLVGPLLGRRRHVHRHRLGCNQKDTGMG